MTICLSSVKHVCGNRVVDDGADPRLVPCKFSVDQIMAIKWNKMKTCLEEKWPELSRWLSFVLAMLNEAVAQSIVMSLWLLVLIGTFVEMNNQTLLTCLWARHYTVGCDGSSLYVIVFTSSPPLSPKLHQQCVLRLYCPTECSMPPGSFFLCFFGFK